jgi:hypothetical protein
MRILILGFFITWASLVAYTDIKPIDLVTTTANQSKDSLPSKEELRESSDSMSCMMDYPDNNERKKADVDSCRFVSVNEYNCFKHIEFPEESRAISCDSVKPTPLLGYCHGDTLELFFPAKK